MLNLDAIRYLAQLNLIITISAIAGTIIIYLCLMCHTFCVLYIIYIQYSADECNCADLSRDLNMV